SARLQTGRPGADLERTLRAVEAGMHGKTSSAALARDLCIGRATQPASRRKQRDRFEQVGLAGAVLTREHDHARPEVERKRGVVAEIRKRQPADEHRTGAGLFWRRRHVTGSTSFVAAYTRIGIST